MGSSLPTLICKPHPHTYNGQDSSVITFKRPPKSIGCLSFTSLCIFFFFPIRKENPTSNLLKNQVLSLGRHSKKNLITCISFTLLSSLPQIRKSCEGRQSQMQSLVTCSGQKFRHLVILADLIWLSKDII